MCFVRMLWFINSKLFFPTFKFPENFLVWVIRLAGGKWAVMKDVISFVASTTNFTVKKIWTSNYFFQVLVSDFITVALSISHSPQSIEKVWMEEPPNIFITYSCFFIIGYNCDNYHIVFLALFLSERYQIGHRSGLSWPHCRYTHPLKLQAVLQSYKN